MLKTEYQKSLHILSKFGKNKETGGMKKTLNAKQLPEKITTNGWGEATISKCNGSQDEIEPKHKGDRGRKGSDAKHLGKKQ